MTNEEKIQLFDQTIEGLRDFKSVLDRNFEEYHLAITDVKKYKEKYLDEDDDLASEDYYEGEEDAFYEMLEYFSDFHLDEILKKTEERS